MSSASFFPRLNCLSIVFFPPLPCRSQHTDLHIIKKSVHKFHNASTRLTPIVVILSSWTLPEICPLGYVLCLPSVIPGSYIVFRITGFCMVNNKRQRLQDRLILPSFFPLAVRSLLFWSLEHVYSRPAALSALHCFRHLSVLSNAREPYLSESSLPNVQGVVCLSTLCSQLAVLLDWPRFSARTPRTCTEPAPNLRLSVRCSYPAAPNPNGRFRFETSLHLNPRCT